jgi:hypothetical protein
MCGELASGWVMGGGGEAMDWVVRVCMCSVCVEYGCMYARMCVCACVRGCGCMYGCMQARIYRCIWVYLLAHIHMGVYILYGCIYIWVYVLVYAVASIMCTDRSYHALNLYAYMAIRVVPPILTPPAPFVSIPHFSPLPHWSLLPICLSRIAGTPRIQKPSANCRKKGQPSVSR